MNRTSNRRPASHALGLALLALPVLVTPATPALADWLVTREGARVETRGTWQEKGKLVVFTLPDGTLSSLRADLVDLDASRLATAEAKVKAQPAPAPAAKPKRRSVRSLTDKDFPRTSAPPVEGTVEGTTDGSAPGKPDDAEAKDEAAEAPEAGQRNRLEVVSWERAGSVGQAVRLTGLLRNNSDDQVTGIELEAGLYDETGALLVSKGADLESVTLAPGETTPFLVDVPDTFAFSAVKFQTRSAGFKRRAQPPAGPAT